MEGHFTPHTDESKKKISEACKKKWADPEYRKRMSLIRKSETWRFGSTNPVFGGGYKLSDEFKEKCRKRMIGNKCGVGYIHTPERKAMVKNWAGGSKNVNWKGGITPENKKARASIEYKQWRRTVFVRDQFTCQKCLTMHTYINAHHIKPFAKFPELRFEPTNGVTLCTACHRLTHKEMRKFQ